MKNKDQQNKNKRNKHQFLHSIIPIICLFLATSMHVFPSTSLIVSSIPSKAIKNSTISNLPNLDAICKAVDPSALCKLIFKSLFCKIFLFIFTDPNETEMCKTFPNLESKFEIVQLNSFKIFSNFSKFSSLIASDIETTFKVSLISIEM